VCIDCAVTGSSRHVTPKLGTRSVKRQTPGGTIYEEPEVDYKLMPIIGKVYGTMEDCEKMYQEYASASGFDIRKSTQTCNKYGVLTKKYYVCNRAGEPGKWKLDTLEDSKKTVRKSTMERTGCRAKVRFEQVPGAILRYKLADFQPIHNHEMLRQEYKHLSKTERQLRYAEQIFVYKASLANIGPTKAHQLYSNIKGGEEFVKGTAVDFRNWKRDLNVFINESDSHMLVNKMEEKSKYVPEFSFYYKVEDNILHSLFWADEIAKCNYNEFNDVMSFDATYRTNRYVFKQIKQWTQKFNQVLITLLV